MITFLKECDEVARSLKDYALIIPSVSVGNIGQLAIDLIIETLKLKRIGYIRHRNILPVIGFSTDTKSVKTECEIYASVELKICVLQIRSGYGPFASISLFFSEMCKSVKDVIILTGSFAYERKDIHDLGNSVRVMQTGTSSLPQIPIDWKCLDALKGKNIARIHIPGSGIADHLFYQCQQEGVAATILVMFVSEGDNRADAAYLATCLDSWLNLRKSRAIESGWQSPLEWTTLFGNTFPGGIF